MTVSLEPTEHLTDETIAAYVDGLLDADARAEADRHMTNCNDCYTIYGLASDAEEEVGEVAGADVPTPPRPEQEQRSRARFGRRAWLIASVAVAASLVALLWAPAHQWYVERTAGIPALVRAAHGVHYRTIDARISGGFEYKPRWNVRDGGDAAPADDAWPIAATAALVKERSAGDASPDALHALGLSHLLAGRATDAVVNLEEAVMRDAERQELPAAISATVDVDLLSDLSAAYLARGRNLDKLAALNAAEHAWNQQKKPEIAWNRALAIAAVKGRAASVEAWQDFLALDSTSPWADEARTRLQYAQQPVASTVSDGTDQLQAAVRRGDRDELLRAVRNIPAGARRYLEEELLPAWALSARTQLNAERQIGEALTTVTGDRLCEDTVRLLASTSAPSTRNAISLFGVAMRLYRSKEFAAARPALERASSALEAIGSPLALRAQMFAATVAFEARDFEAVTNGCRRVRQTAAASGYTTVVAQCHWNEGLVEASRRQLDAAHDHYENARRLFAAASEQASAYRTEVVIGENRRLLGDVEGAWDHVAAALDGLPAPPYVLLSEAAKIAEAAELPYAALAFYEQSIVSAGSDEYLADALLSRAKLRHRLGDDSAANSDLRNAQSKFARVRDRVASERLAPRLALAKASLTVSRLPRQALALVRDALTSYERADNHIEIARAYLLAARAELRQGDAVSAERSLRQARAEIEAERSGVSADSDQLVLLDASREIDDELIAILDGAGRIEEAFLVADGGKGRTLLAASTGPAANTAAVLAALRPDVAYIAYYTLPDRVLIWCIRDGVLRRAESRIDRGALARTVSSALAGMATRGADDREASSTLFSLLIEPVRAHLASVRRLVVVPDHDLRRVAFAALIDQSSGRRLLEDYTISSSPSLAWTASQSQAAAASMSLSARGVIVAPRSTVTSEGTPSNELEGAEFEAATLRRQLRQASSLLGALATAARFRVEVERSSFTHFGGHAVDDDRRTRRAALILADRPVTAAEISRWRLPSSSLVTLAACDTSSGHIAGSGTASLARAFLVAGAKRVVSTLWAVDDDAAGEFSRRLYERLMTAASAADALRETQLSFINDSRREHSSPRHWAAFAIVGADP